MATMQQPDTTGPVPEDNAPGHHPEHEQDKPSGSDFVRKVHEHAREVDAAVDEQERAAAEPEPTVAGEVLRATAGVLRKVRESLPDAG
ncbi:MAG: hypothetical protein V7636_424 [Actinomycetota bacterium]|jgi:hypothetical protein